MKRAGVEALRSSPPDRSASGRVGDEDLRGDGPRARCGGTRRPAL